MRVMQASAVPGRGTRGGRCTSSGRRAAEKRQGGYGSGAWRPRLAARRAPGRRRSAPEEAPAAGAGCPAASCHFRQGAALGCAARPFLAHGRMVGNMALTPARGARFDVLLPGFHCWRSDALRFDTLGSASLGLGGGDAVALLLARVDAWSIIVCRRRASSRAARVSMCECRRWSRGTVCRFSLALKMNDFAPAVTRTTKPR
jgi:hypothetical protein